MNRKYPIDLQRRAVALVHERRVADPRDRTVFREVAAELEVGEQSLRLWVQKFDAERLPQASAAEATGDNDEEVKSELEALRRTIQKLQAENDVLKRAFVVLSSDWTK